MQTDLKFDSDSIPEIIVQYVKSLGFVVKDYCYDGDRFEVFVTVELPPVDSNLRVSWTPEDADGEG